MFGVARSWRRSLPFTPPRRIGGVDCREEGCAERRVLYAHTRCLRVLRAPAIGRPLRDDVNLVCLRAYVEVNAGERAVRAFAARILAAGQGSEVRRLAAASKLRSEVRAEEKSDVRNPEFKARH
jgi:hypothetical protein